MRELPTGWRTTTIGEVCSLYIGGSPFKKLEYTSSGYPVLAKGDVKPFGRVVHSGRYVNPELVDKMGYRLTEPGDMLLTTRDLTQEADFLGLVAPIPTNQRYLINQGANIIRLNEKIDQRYFVYWCNTRIYHQYVKTHHVGSTQIHLRKNDFLNAPIWLPPLSEQHTIAHILGSLDDKIDLNSQMNTTLEAIGQALFKHWFVDFEFPNEEGKPYKSSGGEMVETELEEVPRGWRVVSFGEIVEVRGGSTPKTENPTYWNGDIPWITPKDLTTSDRIHFSKTSRYITQAGLESISKGLLPSSSVLLSSRAPIGYVAINDVPMATNQGFINIICSNRINNLFLFFWLKFNKERLLSFANGTTFQELSKSSFKKIKLILPPETQMNLFRDALLPKLMSGEVRISTNSDLNKENK